MTEPEIAWIAAGALAIGAGLFGALYRALQDRRQWLMAVLLAALAYMLVSLAPGPQPPGIWHPILRWGLFVFTLAAFVRFRWLGRSVRGEE